MTSSLIKEYKHLQCRMSAFQQSAIALISKTIIQESAKRLGMLVRGTLVFDSEEATAILMDYCLYNHFLNGRNAMARYIAAHPPQPGSDEAILALGAQKAWYSVFSLQPGTRDGESMILDAFTDARYPLMDISLSRTAPRDGAVVAGRIVPLRDYCIATGALIPIWGEGIEAAKPILRRFQPHATREREYAPFSPTREANFAGQLIRTVLAANATERVRYQDID